MLENIENKETANIENIENKETANIENKDANQCNYCNVEYKIRGYKRQRKIINNGKVINVSSVGIHINIGNKYLGIKEYVKLDTNIDKKEKKPYFVTKTINGMKYKENVSFIGGKIEIGQTIECALYRELKEELQNVDFANFLFGFITKNTVKIYIPRCKMLVYILNLNPRFFSKINEFIKNTGNSENCLHCGTFFQYRSIEFMTLDYVKRRGDIRMKAILDNVGEIVTEIIPYFIFGKEKSLSEEERIKIFLKNNKNIILPK